MQLCEPVVEEMGDEEEGIHLNDDLQELLDDGVKNSEALLLVQTASVLHRPWTIVQVYEALKQGKQLICVHVTGSGYDFNTVREFLTNVRRSAT